MTGSAGVCIVLLIKAEGRDDRNVSRETFGKGNIVTDLLWELRGLVRATVGTPLEGDEDLTALFSYAEIELIVKRLNEARNIINKLELEAMSLRAKGR